MKQVLIDLWNWLFDFCLKLKNRYFIFIDKLYQITHEPPKIVTVEQTIDYICTHRISISRFGDGEIKIVSGKDLAFQHCSSDIRNRMIEVLSVPIQNHIVCLPDIFSSLDKYEKSAASHWKLHLAYYRKFWYMYINRNRQFYNAFISRPYMMFNDKANVGLYFKKIKELWQSKDVLLIEGEKSRLGVGNDLLDNVHSISRILGPNKEAFDIYSTIIEEVKKFNAEDYIVLLALGPTATIMAYDLAKLGYQAIDIGHIDVEYEWFRMKVTKKVPVKNKFVNEAGAGKGIGDIDDEKYLSEIIWHY